MRKAISIAATCITAVVAGCSSPRKQVTDSANGDVSVAHSRSSAKPISFLQVSGRWNVRAISEIGDTTATTFVLSATSSPQGWTITFPNGTTTPARVLLVAGDSFVVEAGPYPSARRQGLQATAREVYHLQRDQLVGSAVERYVTTGPDSIVRLRLEGSHAP